MKNKKGFTLAEVLITLGIIGVVAAMTIPTLINNNQKAQYVTGLKKAYTAWNQALVQIASDKGCVGDLACTALFDTGVTNQTLGTELVKYFKVAKNCESSNGGPTITGCFPETLSPDYDGSGRGHFESFSLNYYRFITADGMAFAIMNYDGFNCQQDYSLHVTNNMAGICGEVIIDVNGLKGPNNFGRDIFDFYITNGKGPLLYPHGGSDDDWGEPWQDSSGNVIDCYPGSNEGGRDCTGRVIEEGWQMKY